MAYSKLAIWNGVWALALLFLTLGAGAVLLASWHIFYFTIFLHGIGFIIAFIALLFASFIDRPVIRWTLCLAAFSALVEEHIGLRWMDKFDGAWSGYDKDEHAAWAIISYYIAGFWVGGLLLRKWLATEVTPPKI